MASFRLVSYCAWAFRASSSLPKQIGAASYRSTTASIASGIGG